LALEALNEQELLELRDKDIFELNQIIMDQKETIRNYQLTLISHAPATVYVKGCLYCHKGIVKFEAGEGAGTCLDCKADHPIIYEG